MGLWLSVKSYESFGANREPLTVRWWRDMAYPHGVPARLGSVSDGAERDPSPPQGTLTRVLLTPVPTLWRLIRRRVVRTVMGPREAGTVGLRPLRRARTSLLPVRHTPACRVVEGGFHVGGAEVSLQDLHVRP